MVDRALFSLEGATIDRLNLAGAALLEGQSHARAIPRGAVDAVLEKHSEVVGDLIAAHLSRGFAVHDPEILLVSKTRGRRPVALLSTWERVVLRAMVRVVEPLLPTVSRGTDIYEEFKLAPLLEEVNASFVVMSDIASCYQYVDHGLVESELVSQTGEPQIARGISNLLGAVMGRSFGLPQNRKSSDQVAEVVLALVDRRLQRQGIRMWRYGDDYRFAANDRSEAHEILEELEHQLGSIGLVVNEEKTSIRTVEGYDAWARGVGDRIRAAEAEFDFDFSEFLDFSSSYAEPEELSESREGDVTHSDQPDEPEIDGGEPHEVPARTALRLLSQWQEALEESGVRARYGPDAIVDRTIVGTSLRVLGRSKSPAGLVFCRRILNSDPSLTPSVAIYLTRMMETDEDAVDDVYADVLGAEELFVSDWQSMWLLEPLRLSNGLTDPQLAWLDQCSGSKSALVRASTGDVLAEHGRASIDSLVSAFDAAPVGARPRIVSAVARATADATNPQLRLLTDGRPLYDLIARQVIEDDGDI